MSAPDRPSDKDFGPVPGLAELIHDTERFLSDYVTFVSPTDGIVCAVWVAHTYVFRAFGETPYLLIWSPVKRSGKSTLLSMLSRVSCGGYLCGRITPAALVRFVDKGEQTLFIDEADKLMDASTEFGQTMAGVLNNGFSRDGRYVVCEGPKNEVKQYETFGPRAIAGIGAFLDDTTRDRCVEVKLRRRKEGEGNRDIERRHIYEPRAKEIRERFLEWRGSVELEDLERRTPDETGFFGRDADRALPFLVLSELAGNDISKRVRGALLDHDAGRDVIDDGESIELLSDIRRICEASTESGIHSRDLCEELADKEDGNWTWFFDKGVDPDGEKRLRGNAQRKLADMLKAFDKPNGTPIKSADLRLPGGVRKGYEWQWFDDVFERYLERDPADSEEALQARQALQTPETRAQNNGDVADVADVADSQGTHAGVQETLLERPRGAGWEPDQ